MVSGLFAPRTVRPMDASPRIRHFAPWAIRPIDVSKRGAGRNVHGANCPLGEKSIKGKVSHGTGDHLTRQVLAGVATSPVLPEGGPEIDVM